ncbi:hypothetical protein ASC94_29485 [Massilia sp. Root418]|uniref:DUF6447 family protein n=1 Tax=Massilia sp. Root418 TaxID=1736532 RepID=UPI0006F50712|nr:DUF6447 family protein [Massilia sp. Root418]KQW87501.1 hypothetical protein ASC94_29485 [Massilia sp. Root418]
MTERYLVQALPEIAAFFLELRAHVDPSLQRLQPAKLGKPYPMGQCLEISLAVAQLLDHADVAGLALSEPARAGYAAFVAFRKAGGQFRRMWGDLRGEFFQNAFQLGTFYLDVSNDTVTPSKPKVELLPFDEARFVPIADFRHFARIATGYWQHAIYPNHLLPELAPYCPLIHVAANGQAIVAEGTDYMVAMAQAGRFEPSEDVLRDAPMPVALHERLAGALADGGWKVAQGPDQGRAMALRACREHRRKGWHVSQQKALDAITAVQHINRKLALAAARPPAGQQSQWEACNTMSAMSTIDKMQINGITYDLADLSPEAKQQLEMVRATDAKLADLKRDMAIIQTARNVYVAELVKLLPAQK